MDVVRSFGVRHEGLNSRGTSRSNRNVAPPFHRVPSTGLDSVGWTPVSKRPDDSAASFLRIDSRADIHMDRSADMGRTSFWDSLDFDENERCCSAREKPTRSWRSVIVLFFPITCIVFWILRRKNFFLFVLPSHTNYVITSVKLFLSCALYIITTCSNVRLVSRN